MQRFLSSGGFRRCQICLGTTPNIAPPSSLKKPVFIVCSCIKWWNGEKSERSERSEGAKRVKEWKEWSGERSEVAKRVKWWKEWSGEKSEKSEKSEGVKRVKWRCAAPTVLWGCHLLGKLGSANNHPQKRHIPRQAGWCKWYWGSNRCLLWLCMWFIVCKQAVVVDGLGRAKKLPSAYSIRVATKNGIGNPLLGVVDTAVLLVVDRLK